MSRSDDVFVPGTVCRLSYYRTGFKACCGSSLEGLYGRQKTSIQGAAMIVSRCKDYTLIMSNRSIAWMYGIGGFEI